jgi:LmbE family N-acetylglucosaminyl deacetylase
MARFDAEYVPKSALAIYAHPDDVEFTVAGTLARWARGGCDVRYLLLTRGDAGSHDPKITRGMLGKIREREQRAAAAAIGVREVIFLGHHDCELVPTLSLRKEIVREVRKVRPEVVVCGDPRSWLFEDRYVNHPDHRAAARAAVEAVFPASEMEVLWRSLGKAHKVAALYLSSTLEPNVFVDITDTFPDKIRALMLHESQMGGVDRSDYLAERAEAEAAKGREAGAIPKGAKGRKILYAESFRVMRMVREED